MSILDLASEVRARARVAIIIDALDAAGDPTPLRFTNARTLFTSPSDDPPNAPFRSTIVGGFDLEKASGPDGSFFGSPSIEAAVSVSNADGSIPWQDLQIVGRPMCAYLGAEQNNDGTEFPWSDFERQFTGVASSVTPESESILRFVSLGQIVNFDEDFLSDTYRGFGGAIGGTGTLAAFANDHTDFDLSSALSIGWRGILVSYPGTTGAFLRRKQDYGLVVSSAGDVGFVHGGGTVESFGYTVPTGEVLGLLCAGSLGKSGWVIDLWAGDRSEDVSKVASVSFASLPLTSGSLFIGRYPSGGSWPWETWWAALWSRQLDDEEIANRWDAMIPDPSSETDLVEEWRFGAGLGSTAHGSLALHSMTLEAGITWEATNDGDDPLQFGGSVTGQLKPHVIGDATNVPVTSVDTQRGIRQFNNGASGDLRQLRSGGAPLFPLEIQAASKAGDVALEATDTIIFTDPLTGHRFVAGFSEPAADGQTIEIQSSGSAFDDTYRVQAAGISSDGLRVRVETIAGGDPGFTTGDLAATTVVRTPAGDENYSYDLAVSTVTTSATDTLTADVLGHLGAGSTAKASDLAALVTGKTIVTDLDVDPVLDLAPVLLKPATRRSLLGLIARSCCGYAIEHRGGSILLATLRPPGTTAAATIFESKTWALSNPASIQGRIETIESDPVEPPPWQIRISWGRSWVVQTELPGVIPHALKDRYGSDHRFAIRSSKKIRDDHPNARKADPILTAITTQSDAEQVADLFAKLLLRSSRWYSLRAAGIGLHTLEPGADVSIQHGGSNLDIEQGRMMRVSRIFGDSSSAVAQIVGST